MENEDSFFSDSEPEAMGEDDEDFDEDFPMGNNDYY